VLGFRVNQATRDSQAKSGSQIMTTTRPTTEETTEAWSERIVGQKESFNLALIHLLEELAKGEPISSEHASEVLGLPLKKIDKMFVAIDAAGGQLDDQGNFIGMVLTLKLAATSSRIARAGYVDDVIDSIPVIPYDTKVATEHAHLLVAVRQTGRPRGAHDLLIAATARATNRSVVTADESAFDSLPGVAVQLHR
jgi:predicted nucleic acid-binding protein